MFDSRSDPRPLRSIERTEDLLDWCLASAAGELTIARFALPQGRTARSCASLGPMMR